MFTRTELLQATELVARRAEDVSREDSNIITESIFPPVNLEGLLSNNNYLISGRNGTGKTHIFLAAVYRALAEVTSRKALPIYVNCRSFVHEYNFKSGDSTQIQVSFAEFILDAMIHELERYLKSESAASLIDVVFRTKRPEKANALIQHLRKLHDLVHVGAVEERLVSRSHTQVTTETRKDVTSGEIQGQVSGRASISGQAGLDGGVQATGKLSGLNEKTHTISIEERFEGEASKRYTEARRELVQICEECSICRIHIFIDEFSDIPLEFQPHVCDILRRFFISTSIFNIKIASLPNKLRLQVTGENGQIYGLQPGVDIHYFFDLDEKINYWRNPGGVGAFLWSALYRQLSCINHDIRQISTTEFVNQVSGELFTSNQVAEHVILASAGVVRDFIGIMHILLQEATRRPEERLNAENVNLIIMKYFQTEKLRAVEGDGNLAKIYKRIVDKLSSQKTLVFSIRDDNVDALMDVHRLDFLRVVHRVERGVEVEDSNGNLLVYHVYVADFGRFLSIKSDKNKALLAEFMRRARESGFMGEIKKIVGSRRNFQVIEAEIQAIDAEIWITEARVFKQRIYDDKFLESNVFLRDITDLWLPSAAEATVA